MSDPNDTRHVDALNEEASQPLFGPDTRLVVSQWDVGEEQLTSIGTGTLASPLAVGQPLRLRIRRQRGLETSDVRSLVYLSERDLAVVTEATVYVVSHLDRDAGVDLVAELRARLTDESLFPAEDSAGLTDYVRLDTREGERERALGKVRIRVQRGDTPQQDVGVGELLSDVAVGAPVRFTTEDGAVRVTSDIVSVRWRSEESIEVETANSRYLFEAIE
ncbi:MAG: hypothetical protein AAF430_12020 [Myxococcota bacterium]